MKKGMGVILVLLICFFFLGGSSLQKDDQRDQSGRRKDTFIPLQRPNIFTLNFHELYDQILAKVKAEDNKVANPTVDILFTPEGEIMHVDCSVIALEKSSIDEDEYNMGLFRIRNNHETDFKNKQTLPDAFSAPSSTMTGVDVYWEIGGNFKWESMDMFNFAKFPKFKEWIANLNLKSILEKYKVGHPVRYQFQSEKILNEVVENPDVHITYLDCSSTDIHEIEKPKSYQGINYLQFKDKDYYAVIPYYLQDGTIKGFNERKLGQTETEKITYIANHVILLIVDKTEEE